VLVGPRASARGTDRTSDDKTKADGTDRSRINLNEDYEVGYWTQALGCTEQQLRDAVVAVGVMADDVRKYLSRAAGPA